MHRIKSCFLLTLFLIASLALSAQNNTNSPYSRYGYGRLGEQAFGSQRAMGGIGIGLRNPQMINTLNPASYSVIDSMTFMFDFGVMGQAAWYSDGTNKSDKINGNIEYLAFQFPILKGLGMGIGLEPVSYKGYKYGASTNLTDPDVYWEYYTGTGGLNKVYASISYSFLDRISIGAKIGYLFGDLIDGLTLSYNNTNYSSIVWADSLRTSGLTYEFGLQYTQPIGKDKSLTIGAIYIPKTEINGTVRSGMTINSSPAWVSNSVARDSIFEMPQTFGVGVSFAKRNHYTIGADIKLQQWEDARFYDRTDSLSNNMKINLGGEYIPNYLAHSLFKRIRYRAGAYYSDSYINVGGNRYKEYGATLGFGFPLSDRRSSLNVAFDYTMIKPDVSNMGMIDEKYFKITVSYTFNEMWFFRRKIQ